MIEKRTGLNHCGVKNSADMWRTFNGAHYAHWTSEAVEDEAARLRAQGVRCRRVKDELFIHHEDWARLTSAAGQAVGSANLQETK